jgi:hypothetical protein
MPGQRLEDIGQSWFTLTTDASYRAARMRRKPLSMGDYRTGNDTVLATGGLLIALREALASNVERALNMASCRAILQS